ncbi:MAG: DUF4389 domain-containing protein [Dehalococcoidia bacterium]
MSVQVAQSDYPVRYSVDYPTGPRNRLTVFFRVVLVIPILIVLGLVSGGAGGGNSGWRAEGDGARNGAFQGRIERGFERDLTENQRRGVIGAVVGLVATVVVLAPAAVSAGAGMGAAAAPLGAPIALMLIFRRKYPKWWYDFDLQVGRFAGRVGAYAALQRDEYPSTDEEQAVHLDVDYPDAGQLNRWLPLVKWFLAIPHYIVLGLLFIGLIFTTLLAWLAILVTGSYPRPLFDYSVGVARWAARVSGYAFLLVTDRYPPFSLR